MVSAGTYGELRICAQGCLVVVNAVGDVLLGEQGRNEGAQAEDPSLTWMISPRHLRPQAGTIRQLTTNN